MGKEDGGMMREEGRWRPEVSFVKNRIKSPDDQLNLLSFI